MFEQDLSGGDISQWKGHPSHQAAHEAFLEWLQSVVASFVAPPVPNPVDSRTKGNLGESIAAFIGLERSHVGHRCDGPNYSNPLSGISRSEIDLTWIQFGDSSELDVAWLQEVKTSSDPHLAVARDLKVDYEKLFGTDVKLTLTTRLQAIANRLRFVEQRPDLGMRIRALGATHPGEVTQVRLEPTIVTEPQLASTASARLLSAVSSITTIGWKASLITTHLVLFDDLEGRLSRLAGGNK